MTEPDHPRSRFAAAAALVRDLWGDALPPGLAPWRRVAADVIGEDDRQGTRKGLAVQGDALPLDVVEGALSYVPDDAPLWKRVPDELADRLEVDPSTTEDSRARAAEPGRHGRA